MTGTSSRIARIIPALGIIGSGCMVPKPITLAAPLADRTGVTADAATHTYGHVRLTLRDGSRVELRHVRVTRDSIHAVRRLGRSPVQVAFSRGDVARAEEMVIGGYDTIMVLGIVSLAAMAIVSWLDSRIEVPIDLGPTSMARPSAAAVAPPAG